MSVQPFLGGFVTHFKIIFRRLLEPLYIATGKQEEENPVTHLGAEEENIHQAMQDLL